MTAIVRIALRRPYTFVVLALLLLIIGPLAASRTPVDIFPEIRIPIIAVVWSFTGLPPEEMAGRMVSPFERALTTTVNDIEHIEANSYTTVGIVKIFFHPGTDVRTANAQVTAISQTMLRQMPPAPCRRSFSTTMRRPSRSSSWRSPARDCPSRRCSISASTSCACPSDHGARRGDALAVSAASFVRSRSTSTRWRCGRAAFPARTSPTRWPRRT